MLNERGKKTTKKFGTKNENVFQELKDYIIFTICECVILYLHYSSGLYWTDFHLSIQMWVTKFLLMIAAMSV